MSASQPSEEVPDSVPGWFVPRRTAPRSNRIEREAVRFLDIRSFPVNFLRDGEAVWLPARPQLGVCVGQRGSDSHLAVPPGRWMVRDEGGKLHLWREEDFAEGWVRNFGRLWLPPVERIRDNPHLQEGYIEKVAAELAEGAEAEHFEGWEGTEPAEDTRRALIGDLIPPNLITAEELEAQLDKQGRPTVGERLRRFYWRRIRHYETELCHFCGRPVRVVWWCHDDRLWQLVTGHKRIGREAAAGVRCIPCFDAEAKRSGAGWIEWAPVNLRHLGEP